MLESCCLRLFTRRLLSSISRCRDSRCLRLSSYSLSVLWRESVSASCFSFSRWSALNFATFPSRLTSWTPVSSYSFSCSWRFSSRCRSTVSCPGFLDVPSIRVRSVSSWSWTLLKLYKLRNTLMTLRRSSSLCLMSRSRSFCATTLLATISS